MHSQAGNYASRELKAMNSSHMKKGVKARMYHYGILGEGHHHILVDVHNHHHAGRSKEVQFVFQDGSMEELALHF